jgi:uncharacterized protein involved in exopolysaccharide biosynthesis
MAVDFPSGPPPSPSLDPLRLVRAVGREWRLTLAVSLGAAVFAYLGSFLLPTRYTTMSSFVAESRDLSDRSSALAGFASRLNLALPSLVSRSPQFFADVLVSRAVLDAVLSQRDDTAAVAEFFGRPTDDAGADLERARRRLRRSVGAAVSSRTGIITLTVRMRSAVHAKAVADRMVRELDRFNRYTRESQARARRDFAERRLRDAEDSLKLAEGSLRSFSERNRMIASSPGLRLELDRINRRVARWQDLVTSLHREYEIARIDEVNDTPIITILESPNEPVRPSSPRRLVMAAAGLLLGFLAVAGRVAWQLAARSV